jgi:hypothetical protein
MAAYEVFVHYSSGEISCRLIAVAKDRGAAARVVRSYGMVDGRADRLQMRLLKNYKKQPVGTLLIGPDSSPV